MSLDKIGNNFLQVPRLPADGKGFIVWRECLELLVKAQGLFGHLDGMATKLVEPMTTGAMAPMPEQVSTRERYPKELSQYLQEQVIVFQQIMSTIPDSLYLKIKGKPTIKEAWDTLKADFKRWSQMIMIKLCKQLQNMKCAENGNVHTHFDNLQAMQEELASLGTVLSE